MNLLVKNVTWLDAALKPITGDVRISGDAIVETGENLVAKKKEQTVDFTGHFMYAGLINAHDHLEMNLYPRLGTPPYHNYTEWSKDIYKPQESPLKEIEKTDIEHRLMWGGLKNLVSGVTTVVHHNPWHRMLGKSSFPVVVPKINWAHSLAFEKKLPKKVDEKVPFVIHAAEGIDDFARNEIYKLDELGLLRKNTVIVHGISADFNLLASRGASLVWCPASNLFMFSRTITSTKGINISLGTDSTLTGSPTLLDEMKVALRTGVASKEEIFGMVHRSSKKADLVITPMVNDDPIENLFEIQPKDISMVMVRGEIKLQHDSIVPLRNTVRIQGIRKSVAVDADSLKQYFEKKIPAETLEANALWRMLA